MTALWLAAKLEETHVSTPGLLRVFDRITRRQDAAEERILDPVSEPFYEMHEELIRTERAMLTALGFNCQVEHPHKLIINIVKVVLDWDTQLCQLAWSLCNDRYDILLARRDGHPLVEDEARSLALAVRDMRRSTV